MTVVMIWSERLHKLVIAGQRFEGGWIKQLEAMAVRIEAAEAVAEAVVRLAEATPEVIADEKLAAAVSAYQRLPPEAWP